MLWTTKEFGDNIIVEFSSPDYQNAQLCLGNPDGWTTGINALKSKSTCTFLWMLPDTDSSKTPFTCSDLSSGDVVKLEYHDGTAYWYFNNVLKSSQSVYDRGTNIRFVGWQNYQKPCLISYVKVKPYTEV